LNGRRSLNVQAIALVIGSAVAQLLVAALYILTARSMQPENYGPVVAAIGMGLAAAGFLDLGSTAYWIRELASVRITHESLDSKVFTRLVITAGIAIVVILGSLVVAPKFVAVGVLMLSTSIAQSAFVPIRAQMRSESVAWLMVLGRVVAVALFGLQVHAGVGHGLALWTSLAIGDLAAAACAVAVTPAGDRLGIRICPLSNPWAGSKWYAVSVASTSAAQLDLPIIAALSGPAAAGIYGGVSRWTQPVLVATGAFAQATAPFIAAEAKIKQLRGELLRASWILIAAVGLSLAIFMTAPWLVSSLLGDDFGDSAPVLRLLALAMLCNTVNQPLTVALQSRRFDRLAAGLVLASVATHLVVTLLLAPSMGAVSAGIGMLSAQIVGLVGTVSCVAFITLRRRSFAP
jgi:O-antigen/teichoic acid export membrane protein